MKRFRLNRSGFSLMEMMVGGSVLAILAVGAVKFFGMMGKAGNQMGAVRTAQGLRSSVLALVNSPKSWQRTIAEQAGGALECLAKSAAGDCQGKGGPISLYSAGGQEEFEVTPTAGFTASGSPCDGFASSGSRACPFRVDVEWEPICASPAPAKCPNPQVRIIANIRYRPTEQKRNLAFNESNYSINIIRGQPLSNAGEFCESIGAKWIEDEQRCDTKKAFCAAINGIFDETSGTCTLPTEVDCDPGDAVNQISIVDGVAKPECIPVSDDFDPYDFQVVPRPYNDADLRLIPQEEITGCQLASAPASEPAGLPCRQDRPAGMTGTCYYRLPVTKAGAPINANAGWYRVGSGYCRGAVYVNQSYTLPFAP